MKRNMNNLEIAELLRAMAASYEIRASANSRFRVIAYENAADAVEHLSSELKDLWDEGMLEDVSGIGPSIAKNLGEIFKTGKSRHFEHILSKIPKSVFELLDLTGVGPKRAYRLAIELNLPDKNPIKKLKRLALNGKIATLPGFGEESERDILKSIKEFEQKKETRMLISRAEEAVLPIINWLKKDRNVIEAVPLGSLRRRASTIGDLDLAVSTKNPEKVIKHFLNFPHKGRVLDQGDKYVSMLVPGNIQVDLRVHEPKSFGSLLQHFTGSKHHNIALREYALKKGLSLSEYGIKELNNKRGKVKPVGSEKEFYRCLGLQWIPPELREGDDEIEAARKKNLPELVELKDVKADLQIHSDFDIETSHDLGVSSMKEIVKKANELKYEYIAFTEHNPSQRGHSQKQIVEILKKKREKINILNSQLPDGTIKKVFNSLEIDILPDGKLPIDETGLSILDFALISIHSSFRLEKNKMTQRVLRALDYPNVKIFAHPTGRLIGKRESIELDWEKIFSFCKEKNIWIEINADPHRLDLPDYLVREAIAKGILLTLGTDAHSSLGMDNMRYGVDVARRGWAKKSDIINARNLKEFETLLKIQEAVR